MTSTTYASPSGLDDTHNLSTALDQARLARYALANPTLRRIVGTREYRTRWSAPTYAKVWVNHNKMLGTTPGVFGLKPAGHARRWVPDRRPASRRPRRDRRRPRLVEHLVGHDRTARPRLRGRGIAPSAAASRHREGAARDSGALGGERPAQASQPLGCEASGLRQSGPRPVVAPGRLIIASGPRLVLAVERRRLGDVESARGRVVRVVKPEADVKRVDRSHGRLVEVHTEDLIRQDRLDLHAAAPVAVRLHVRLVPGEAEARRGADRVALCVERAALHGEQIECQIRLDVLQVQRQAIVQVALLDVDAGGRRRGRIARISRQAVDELGVRDEVEARLRRAARRIGGDGGHCRDHECGRDHGEQRAPVGDPAGHRCSFRSFCLLLPRDTGGADLFPPIDERRSMLGGSTHGDLGGSVGWRVGSIRPRSAITSIGSTGQPGRSRVARGRRGPGPGHLHARAREAPVPPARRRPRLPAPRAQEHVPEHEAHGAAPSAHPADRRGIRAGRGAHLDATGPGARDEGGVRGGGGARRRFP